MFRLFLFITVFALFTVQAANELSAAPLEWKSEAEDFAILSDRPVFAADVELYLGQKTRRRGGGGGRVWSNLYYGDTTLKPKGEEDKINPSFYGLQIGLDVGKGHGVYSTYFLNINRSKTKFSGGTSTIDNYLLGYGKYYYFNICHIAFAGSVGYDRYEVSAGETHKGDGLQTNLFGEFGFDFILGKWTIKPFYALQYDFLYHGNIGQKEDWNGHGLNQLFGLRLNWRVLNRLELQSRAVWVRELLDKSPPFYHMRFSPVHGVNTPAIMFYEGNTGRDWAWLGIGGKFECSFNVYLFFDYDVLLNKQHTTHLGSVGLLLGW